MSRHDDIKQRVHIKPTELHVTDVPTQITTSVGSCLAVTLFVPRLGLAGMTHAVLPSPTRPAGPEEVGKYVTTSVTFILEMMRAIGATNDEIEIKAFGGGNILGMPGNSGIPGVGETNITAFQRLVRREGLRVVASEVGGTCGRRVVFLTHSGDVFMRRIGQPCEPGRSVGGRAKAG